MSRASARSVVDKAERSEAVVDCYIAASSSDSEDELCLYWILLQSTYHVPPGRRCRFFWTVHVTIVTLDHAALILSVFATRPQGEELRL